MGQTLPSEHAISPFMYSLYTVKHPWASPAVASAQSSKGMQESWSTWVKLCTLVQELQDLRQLVFIQPALVAHSPSSAHFWHRSCKGACEHVMARHSAHKAHEAAAHDYQFADSDSST